MHAQLTPIQPISVSTYVYNGKGYGFLMPNTHKRISQVITRKWCFMETQETKKQGSFRHAIQKFKTGDRDAARQIMRHVLLEDPKHVNAWLWMSALVDDVVQQKDCLERALVLDPSCDIARKRLEFLKLQEFVTSIPTNEQAQDDANNTPQSQVQTRKLGEYLIEHNLISEVQLGGALREQTRIQSETGGIRVPLGDVLLKLGTLTPEALATVLVMQQHDKIASTEGQSPKYLGEYLVTKGIVTQDQLKIVLAQQLRLRQEGQKILLGELLVSAGYISPEALDNVLTQQLDDALGNFDDEEEEEWI